MATYREHQLAILATADKAAEDLSAQEYVDLLFETAAALDARGHRVEINIKQGLR